MNNDLRDRRAERDLSQADLAAAVDVSRQTINAIERGRYDPSLELAFELAEYFGCRIEDLFEPGD
jgi:putative transcriptional regulator